MFSIWAFQSVAEYKNLWYNSCKAAIAPWILQTRHKVLHLWYHTPSIYGTLDFDGIVRLIP